MLHPDKDPLVRPTRWLAAATVVIAIASVLGFGTAILTWITLNGQLNEMRQSFAADRAYVLLATFIHGDAPTVGQQFSWVYQNFGRTPAEYRSMETRCDYFPNLPFDFGKPPEIVGVSTKEGLVPQGWIIEVGKTFPSAPAKLNATSEQIDEAKIGNGKIFCEGRIIYDDMRGTEHRTGVCFFFNFQFGVWLLFPDDRYNYHT